MKSVNCLTHQLFIVNPFSPDLPYMEQGSSYPMKHRTLPLAPALSTFYTETTTSLSRPTGLNHEYSEPGDKDTLTSSSGMPHQSGIPLSNFKPTDSRRHEMGVGPGSHLTSCDYEWAAGGQYDQPHSESAQDRLSPAYHTTSTQDRFSPAYHGASTQDFNGGMIPALKPRLPTSLSSGSSRGHPSYKSQGSRTDCHGRREGGGREGGKQRRKKRRPQSRDVGHRELAVRDQATNTDLSSSGEYIFHSQLDLVTHHITLVTGGGGVYLN